MPTRKPKSSTRKKPQRTTTPKNKTEKTILPGQKVVGDRVVPLSEDERKFHPEWSADNCKDELRRIAEANPNQVISRNFFRVHSQISESTWNRYFGTFKEFKRQAGIILDRDAHRMELNIAKHASVDKLRKMNEVKIAFAGKYKRDVGGRFKTALIASDIHDVFCDKFYLRLLHETNKRAQPELIILNGDIYDLPEFSKHFQDPREYAPVERMEWVHAFLEKLREDNPTAEIVFVEGNHEFRLLRHLCAQTPAMMTVLADLHDFTVPKLLGLDEYEVNYIAPADLTAWTERDIKKELKRNWYVAWDCFICHHFPEGFNYGYPGSNGHHHRHTVRHGYSPDFGAYEWHQTGGGHQRSASYTEGEKWTNGFLLAHADTVKRFTQFEYIDTTHHHAVIGGEFYYRTHDELI